MVKPPSKPIAAAVVGAGKFQPHHVFYRVPVLEALKRGNREELTALANGARELQKEYGNFDKMIATLQDAAKRAGQ
ncbi:MAG TPA: hypothetical protein VEW25_11890 [Allosphingosinicella sp.]|nr:hypothetical protein [Allosphingosinicella sp.]